MAAQLLLSALGAGGAGLFCALGASLLGKRKREPPRVTVEVVAGPLEDIKALEPSEAATERVPTDVAMQGASGGQQEVASLQAAAPETAAWAPGAARRPSGGRSGLVNGHGSSEIEGSEEEGSQSEGSEGSGEEEGEDAGEEGGQPAAAAAAAAATAAATAGVAGPWHTVRRDASKEAEAAAAAQPSGSKPDSFLQEAEFEGEELEDSEEEPPAPAKRARRAGPPPPRAATPPRITVVEGWKEEVVEEEEWEVSEGAAPVAPAGAEEPAQEPPKAVAVGSLGEWEAQLALAGDRPTVVAFSAYWPAECLLSQPLIDALLGRLGGGATLLTVDVDDAEAVAEACDVDAIPCFQVWQHGAKVAEHSGADRRSLLAFLDEVL